MLGLIDEFGLLQASLLGGFEFIGQVAQLVGPTALVGHGRPQPAQSPAEAGLTVGSDEFQELSMQAATPQMPQEPIPGIFALRFGHLEINQLSLALAGDAISTQDHSALDLAHQPDPHAHPVQDQITVGIGEPTAMEVVDRAIQSLGHRADGGGADGILDERGQGVAGLAGGDPQQKHGFEGLVDHRLAALVAPQHLGLKMTRAGPGHLQF